MRRSRPAIVTGLVRAVWLATVAACDRPVIVPLDEAALPAIDAAVRETSVTVEASVPGDAAVVLGCASDSECDDLAYCTGTERCVAGRCVTTPRDCDDDRTCTHDGCDEVRHVCTHTNDDTVCSDGDACDGIEACNPDNSQADPTTGCLPAAFSTFADCDDHDLCTMDRCDSSLGCLHTARDVDGDRYIDHACMIASVAGNDCNDGDASIHPGATEVCDDLRDNDCNGLADYSDPACRATNDTCATATPITRQGSIPASTVGLRSGLTVSCSRSLVSTAVFVFTLDAAADVEIAGSIAGSASTVAVFAGASCDTLTEYRCARGADGPVTGSGSPAAVHARALPPGTYRVFAQTGSIAQPFVLDFHVTPVSSRPEADVCPVLGVSPAVDVSDGHTVLAQFSRSPPADFEDDYTLSCSTLGSHADAVYRIVVPPGIAQDLLVTASALYGTTSVSVRRTGCVDGSPELACVAGSDANLARARLFYRGIPSGTYWVIVENSREGDVTLNATLTTTAGGVALDRCPNTDPVDDGDGGTIPVDAGTVTSVTDLSDQQSHVASLVAYNDDYTLSCSRGVLADAVLRLTLTGASSDVRIALDAPAGNTFASLRNSPCSAGDELQCRGRGGSFVLTQHALPPGVYWLFLENSLGDDVAVTATIDPTDAPVTYALATTTDVRFQDACALPDARRVLTNIDDAVAPLPDPLGTFAVPFDVRVYGVRVMPPFVVSTNGYLTFTSSALSLLAGTLPSASEPTFFLAPYAADLATGPSGICYAVTGATGARRLIVQWTNVREARATGQIMVFQAVIEEAQTAGGNNYLDVLYQQLPSVSDPNAFAGIENDDGTAFTVIPGPPWTAPRVVRLVPSR